MGRLAPKAVPSRMGYVGLLDQRVKDWALASDAGKMTTGNRPTKAALGTAAACTRQIVPLERRNDK